MDYDLITVGGGLAGSSLARSMALAGKRVLVLESEPEFRDRVRGEQLTSWGVAEMKELGIYDALADAGRIHEPPYWDLYIGPIPTGRRDLRQTTPQQCANMTYFHPEMQTALLRAARAAGAEIVHAKAEGVEPGNPATVRFHRDGKEERVTARLVAGCDGRNSSVRRWAGFETAREPERLQISGIFLEDLPSPNEAQTVVLNPGAGTGTVIFPQANGRARSYLISRVNEGRKFSGDKDVGDYMATITAGLPDGTVKGARPAGPLATFEGADSYAPHPYRNGVALVGDAAATSDPSWGQGMPLAVHDVRLLRDALLANDDWDAAGHAYAEQHDRDYGNVRLCEDWFTTLFYGAGPEADARRSRAMPGIAQDPMRVPDVFQSGPDCVPMTDDTRKRFFGED